MLGMSFKIALWKISSETFLYVAVNFTRMIILWQELRMSSTFLPVHNAEIMTKSSTIGRSL